MRNLRQSYNKMYDSSTLAGCNVLARNESFIQFIYCTIQATNGYDNKCQDWCL